jgi:hypothetical protein
MLQVDDCCLFACQRAGQTVTSQSSPASACQTELYNAWHMETVTPAVGQDGSSEFGMRGALLLRLLYLHGLLRNLLPFRRSLCWAPWEARPITVSLIIRDSSWLDTGCRTGFKKSKRGVFPPPLPYRLWGPLSYSAGASLTTPSTHTSSWRGA